MNNFPNAYFDMNSPEIVSALDDLSLWSAAFGQKILDVLRLQPNQNVLDIGCGMGFPLLDLSQRLGNSCQCYGIDPWHAAIRRANDKRRVWGISNCFMFPAVGEHLPFPDAHFDVIFSNNGINNVENDVLVLREIARVCKPGAQLVVTVNLPETFIEFYEPYETLLQELGKYEDTKRLHDHIYRKRKPVDYTKALLRNAGFHIKAMYEDTFSFRFLNGTTMLNHFFIKLAFLPSWLEIVQDKKEQKRIFEKLENSLNTIAVAQHGLELNVPWICVAAEKY